ncbi:MAG: penicillin-binding protein 1C [Salinivirgaceae bacterium]|nr:penicillin-binding protein 1C [Salinivirgaceae bacterium]
MKLQTTQILSVVNKIKVPAIALLLLFSIFYFSLPKELFHDPTSTILIDKQNNLLAAQIANDGQWRFPYNDSVPTKFKQAIILFEDQYFYKHPGFNPFSIIRATKQNIKAKKTVSGASTLTAQVIRLSRKGKQRSMWQKLIEFTLAIRLELRYSKEEILAFYASNAPFGGNVVGLDAAAWRYYGRPPDQLSWGEITTLAVLPNAPSLIYPGKNHEVLLAKRNRLLDKLASKNIIDKETADLAKYEPLPHKPLALPQLTPHLLTRALNENKKGQRIKTTINKTIQNQAIRIVNKHYQVLSQNEILNAAALVIEVKTGNVLAYIGNTQTKRSESGRDVDIVTAPRSTGSTLKPILYAMMQKEGFILPHTLIPDIPTHIAGYTPKNFDRNYSGATPANNALARSLNIPAVRMLRDYGIEQFLDNLNQLNLKTFTKNANYYGLSLILGGAETTLWELSGLYANMARLLNNFGSNNSKYQPNDFHDLHYQINDEIKEKLPLQDYSLLTAGSVWLTFDALTEMHRPIEGSDWRMFESSKRIAWKTGTSFGHRDAWAVGVTPEYVIGVWVGNADGEGRPGLTGASTAAPIMFDLFKQLPATTWFNKPYDDLVEIATCSKSGYKAGSNCDIVDTIYASPSGDRTPLCPYHKLVHLTKNEKYQVNSDCYHVAQMVNKKWFVLTPAIEHYYKQNNPFYKSLPKFHPDCKNIQSKNIAIIYPKQNAKLYIPKGFNQQIQRSVFEAVHSDSKAKLHWHLDEDYLGTTTAPHKMEIIAPEGYHTVFIIDEFGASKTLMFEVLSK